MHNTSEQFYKYLIESIIEFLSKQNLIGGEKYNLYLEREETVQELYQVLKKVFPDKTTSFSYEHNAASRGYDSYKINLGGSELLVVASSSDVTENFITTLRNKISKQENEFQGLNILILFSGKLDSLLGGSESLLKEGMPLNIAAFENKLRHVVKSSTTFEQHEKTVLELCLNKITENTLIDTCSIFDFEEIVSVIHQGTIKKTDYSKLGLFPHKELSTLGNKIRYNISENQEDFRQIEAIIKHGDPSNDFDSFLSERGIKKLTDETNEWSETDYSDIIMWKDQRKNTDPPKFLEVVKSELSTGLRVWERADGYSEAQKRKRSIILFNHLDTYPFKVVFRFDKSIKKDALKTGLDDNIKLDSSGHRIVAEFHEGKIGRWIRYTDKQSRRKYDLKIIILPVQEFLLKGIEKKFLVDKKGKIELPALSEIILNEEAYNDEEILITHGDNIFFDENTKLKIKVDGNHEEEKIEFILNHPKVDIPFSAIAEKPGLAPISGFQVWKRKREENLTFSFSYDKAADTAKLSTENQEFFISKEYKKRLLFEKEIVTTDGIYFELENGKINAQEIDIPKKVEEAFLLYKQSFEGNLSSLTAFDEERIELAKNYISVYNAEIASIGKDTSLTTQQQNLTKIGVVANSSGFKELHFSPFHPLIVAYQIELHETVGEEIIYDAILKRLSPLNLLPYIEWERRKIYTPVESSNTPEWLTYQNKNQLKKDLSKEFVRKLIREKIVEFTTHFSYLFLNKQSPIKINTFNLGDCKEVLQGLFDYYQGIMIKRGFKDINSLPPIELTIYGSEKLVTKFEELTFYNDAKEVKDKSGLDLNFKTGTKYEPDDLLNAFRSRVHFYTKEIEEGKEVEYAHISFFNFNQKDVTYDDNVMSKVHTGIALNGLISDVTSEYNNNSYRTSFSTKDIPEQKSILESAAISCNAIARVAFSNRLFEPDKTICTAIDFSIKNKLTSIYDKSQWVTFIEPKVGLNFFKEKEKVVIIHYSDQYNNTSGYDAITVTKKTTQYQNVIRDFLKQKNVIVNSDTTESIINLFNAVNGDWLLKLIAQHTQFPREKISILSGVKAALAIFYSKDIIWVPVSLEEVLRVSGNAGLKQTEGFLSAKNLGNKGKLSDDLLLIGLHKVGDRLKMSLYPIEVKIGKNSSTIINKAKEQGTKTSKLLRDIFEVKEGDSRNNFKVAIYKNFFAKLALVNTEKLSLYNVWTDNEANWKKILNVYRGRLLRNDFDICDDLDNHIGKFGVLSFRTDNFKRKIELEENAYIISMLENDGNEFLAKDISELKTIFQDNPNSFEKELLLAQNPNFSTLPKKLDEVTVTEVNPSVSDEVETIKPVQKPNLALNAEIRPIKILFGHNVNNNKEVYWYPTTTSKVLHTNTGIIGTMGTGKTQFTKSLITQLIQESSNNVDGLPLGILIFDYKGDYIKEDFVKATNAKVYPLNRLPYNPLAIDVYENALPKLPLHIASSIKETIAKAYNLGNNQQQALRDAVMDAYLNKGIDKNDKSTWGRIAPTIEDMCRCYLEREDIKTDSLYSALDTLSEFEIFEPDSSKTQSLFDLLQGTVVINLAGYDESVQNLVVAITLDLFYSQMQKAGHSKIAGDFRQLNKMILVDEADNFLSKNFKSIRKILKEGREFGVGTILSTQFLSHFSTSDNDYSNYILTWIVHRVNEIKTREIDSLFSLDTKDATMNLLNEIKSLDKHYSVVNLAGSEPIFIKDRAFWELMSNM